MLLQCSFINDKKNAERSDAGDLMPMVHLRNEVIRMRALPEGRTFGCFTIFRFTGSMKCLTSIKTIVSLSIQKM